MIDFENIKAGNYQLHVYIEETRNLVNPSDISSTMNPILKITAFGQ